MLVDRRWRALCAAMVTLLGLIAPAAAQPLPDPTGALSPNGDPRATSSTTKIPITMPGGTEILGAEGAGTSTLAPHVSVEQPIDPNTYICGPGDTFELNFWGQQNFRLRISVDLEGRTFISKVGFITVAGKTLTNVRAQVQKKVRSNYPGLNFELTLTQPRTFLVHVVDNVKQPGSYHANALERVSAVLGRAGGSTGSRRRITIQRRSGETVTADLLLYELTGNTTHNPQVLDGDTIKVPFADVVATISGAVRRPGTYELVKSRDLAELLELAGGFKSSATRTLPLRITRRNKNDQEQTIEVSFAKDAPPNQALLDDDDVHVPSAQEIQRSVLLIGAVVGADDVDAATTSKRLPFVEGDTVWSIITRAGGINASGDLRRSYISRPRAEGPPEVIALDLDALLMRRDLKADKRVAMNDTIVIPPMQYSVFVEGAVSRRGFYPFNPRFGVREYIARAGGRTRSAKDIDDVKVIDTSGITRAFSVDLKPAPGDSILVPERNFTRAEIVQIVMAGAGLVLSGAAVVFAATR